MIESEIDPEQNGDSYGTTRPPNFIRIITNFDEYNAFADETIKASNEFENDDDDKYKHEIKHHELDYFSHKYSTHVIETPPQVP